MITSLTEIIPISPKQPDIPFEDMPTVAENFLPIATARVLPSNANEKQTSYGELWRAWAHSTGFYPEM